MQNEQFGSVEKPIEERVAHIESTLPRFARLNEQQALSDKIESFLSSVSSMSSSQKDLKDRLEALVFSYNDSIKLFAEEHKNFFGFINDAKSKLESLSGSSDSVKKDIQSLFAHKPELESKIEAVHDSIQDHPAFAKADENIAILAAQQMLHKSSCDLVKNSLDAVKSSQSSALKDLDALKRICDGNDLDLNAISQEIQKLKLYIHESFQAVHSGHLESMNALRSEMNSKIDSIPQPEKISLDGIKADFSKQIEPAAFDAKNANLRSSNNESKVIILEKKVEQLYLLISKYELNK